MESHQEDKANKEEEEDIGLQLKQSLAAIDDDDESVEWILSLYEWNYNEWDVYNW